MVDSWTSGMPGGEQQLLGEDSRTGGAGRGPDEGLCERMSADPRDCYG